MESKIQKVIKDPATSFWLLKALEELSAKDPLDAQGDAETLSELMTERLNELLGQNKENQK